MLWKTSSKKLNTFTQMKLQELLYRLLMLLDNSNAEAEQFAQLDAEAEQAQLNWQFILEVCDGSGEPPLITAVEKNSLNGVRYLLNKKAALEAVNAHGETALWRASKDPDKIQCVRLLLEAGAFAGATAKNKRTCLMEAVCSGGEDIAILLLEHGAGLNAQDAAGQSALMSAMRANNSSMTQLLLGQEQQLDLIDAAGETALSLAVSKGEEELAHQLIERGAYSEAFRQSLAGKTLIKQVAEDGDSELLNVMLLAGGEYEPSDDLERGWKTEDEQNDEDPMDSSSHEEYEQGETEESDGFDDTSIDEGQDSEKEILNKKETDAAQKQLLASIEAANARRLRCELAERLGVAIVGERTVKLLARAKWAAVQDYPKIQTDLEACLGQEEKHYRGLSRLLVDALDGLDEMQTYSKRLEQAIGGGVYKKRKPTNI